jgi:signal transduction histidine kinase
MGYKMKEGVMGNTLIEKPGNVRNPLRAKLVIIEALVFLLPGLVIAYVYYQKNISLDTTHMFIFLAVFTLILGGMVILRQVFDRILTVQTLMKNAEEGGRYLLDVQKDTGELHEITKSFNNLMNNFQEANSELQRRLEEIAERKQAEAALQRAKDAAEAVNIAKSRFLANMSHELLTPLNSVIGFSQILLAKTHGELNEKQLRYVNNVLDSGKLLLKLVNTVLELSKIEAESVELELSEFAPDEELREIISMIQPSADKKGIVLSSDIQPKLPNITADREKFRQAVLYLLNNAVEFTPDGGGIRVTANLSDSSSLKARSNAFQLSASDLELHRDWIQISVQDTGIGIRPEDQERIFSIFEQADASQQRLFDGTGLGLAMSRKLVELHKGSIWVESKGEEKGSTFTFVIPIEG